MGSKLCTCNNNNENQKLETNVVKNIFNIFIFQLSKNDQTTNKYRSLENSSDRISRINNHNNNINNHNSNFNPKNFNINDINNLSSKDKTYLIMQINKIIHAFRKYRKLKFSVKYFITKNINIKTLFFNKKNIEKRTKHKPK